MSIVDYYVNNKHLQVDMNKELILQVEIIENLVKNLIFMKVVVKITEVLNVRN